MVDTDPQRNTTNVYRALTNGVPTLYDIIFAQYKASDCIQHTDYGDIIASDDNLESADTMIKPGPGMYKYLRNAIREIDEDYDYIIFDTQPHAGLLLGNVLMACQFIVTPCTCDAFGIQGMMDFYDTIKEYQEDNEKLQILGLLIIKYKGRQSLTKDIEDNLLPQYADYMHTKIFESRIRESVKCQEAQTLRMSIFDYAPNSTTAIDYNNFVDELIREVS
jgi:chromosome partitioning protein